MLVWNEREGCEIDLPRVNQDVFDEVFAIDPGSTDGTRATLERFGVTVHAQKERGLNAAYWQAVETAKSDYVVVFFPKGTIDPAILKNFALLFLEGHDIVIANRHDRKGRNEEDDSLLKPRKWGVSILATVASLIWRREGHKIQDVLHGVKGFSRAAFLKMNPDRTGLCIDLEMTVRAYRLRLRRAEFPVTEIARTYGETRFKILPTSIKLGKFLIGELRRPLPAAASEIVPVLERAHNFD